MADQQSYPSPNAAQMAAGAAGLYAPPNGNITPSEHENAVDPNLSMQDADRHLHEQLRSQLGRVGEAPMTTAQDQQHAMSAPHGMPVQMHTPGPQPSTPQQMAQNAMSMAQDPHYGQQDSGRKRSKVSRACDECRRKKIRCDATSENGPEACTSCKRTGARCQFSRQPMKRGPSKGYIKELADRLNHLESQLGPNTPPTYAAGSQAQAELQYLEQGLAGPTTFSPPAGAQFPNGRKRTHSASEGLTEQYDAAMPQANGVHQPWERRESLSLFEQDPTTALYDWGQDADNTINEYYRAIQETYPLLPFDIGNLKGRLAHADPRVREGFLVALDCLVRVWPATNINPDSATPENLKRAFHALQSVGGAPADKSSGILLVLGFMLIAIEYDHHGTASLELPAGFSKESCIASAAGVASRFELEARPYRQGGHVNFDTDELYGRRTFWVLFILANWHATATASKSLVPPQGERLMAYDEHLLTPLIYNLARLTMALSDTTGLSKILLDIDVDPSWADTSMHNPVGEMVRYTKTLVTSQLDRINEGLTLDSHPLLQLAYWHVHLLTTRLVPTSSPLEILASVNSLVGLLAGHTILVTPPYHHFAALAALVLGELAEREELKDEALRLLGELDNVLCRNQTEQHTTWSVAVKEFVVKKKASVAESGAGSSTNMLEHLAEAAVGERRTSDSKAGETRPESSDKDLKADLNNAAAAAAAAATAAAALSQSLHFEPASLGRLGYLRVLTQVLAPERS